MFIVTIFSCKKEWPRFSFDEYISDDVDKDNRILKPGKIFRYNVMSSEHQKTSGFKFNLLSHDTLNYSDKKQSKILYTFYDSIGTIIPEYQLTGAVDNKYNFWFHPPRFGVLKILNFAPCPYYIYDSNKEYCMQIVVGRNWLEENNKLFKEFSKFEIKHTYTPVGNEKFSYKNEIINVIKLHVKSQITNID